MRTHILPSHSHSSFAGPLAVAAVGLAASAVYTLEETRRAERDYPPTGSFMTVGGVRLHFVDTGDCEQLALHRGGKAKCPRRQRFGSGNEHVRVERGVHPLVHHSIGAAGDASSATAEKGRLTAEHQADGFIALLRDVARFPLSELA